FLGMAAFAVATAMGFLLWWAGRTPLALHSLAIPVAVAGMPILAGGLLLHRRLAETPDEQRSTYRTAGTAIAVAGLRVLVAAVGLAWPQPLALLLVCGLNFVILVVGAWKGCLPALHVPALVSLVVATVLGYHLAAGALPANAENGWLLWKAAGSAPSGAVLMV